ncbi:hypothetical protein DDB_G0289899 [Dictyostelium discoideum AX4]|uniref:Uncharacterized protein n=1 Tax=Dictyostelium discoideum TaxID=44689 RepID=Q54GW0_DICDI|nr:hypothetical protein DDB_G0289899 [Dictyostelium discoideum AX4]EAL62462.1 hypothetical protein DDB_G0289899 [Dictyostelium discoideum AX4]|eukprot:XP_635959.1 hypothetical protein DDB_G0289899 [Dictyostelium discoideum AX4]
MKLSKFIILIIFLIFIIKSNGEQTSSSVEIDDDSKCYGETMETCFTSGSCCIWCGSPKNTTITKVAGVCFLQSSLSSCPQDILTLTGDKCNEYNSASCTCSFRNTTNSIISSSSSPSSLPPINYSLIFISIVLIFPCIFYSSF